jgi:hypothetical protein
MEQTPADFFRFAMDACERLEGGRAGAAVAPADG